jgi:hypothetical protein
LKIIGILLLCILGLILLILLTTLLVPIRYRVEAQHGEQLFYLKGRVSWLLHIVHVRISHIEGQLHIQARLFGYVIYDNRKPRKSKKTKVAKGSKRSERTSKMVKSKPVNKKIAKIKTAKRKAANSNAETSQNESKVHPAIKSDSVLDIDNMNEREILISKEVQTEQKTVTVQNGPRAVVPEAIKTSEGQAETDNKEGAERKSFFKKIWERIKSLKNRIVSSIMEWKTKVIRIFSTITAFRFKLDLILKFLKDEMNKKGMHLTFSSLKKLLKHILPTKLISKITFGTGDPCSTGQALGALSIFYSFYGDKVSITPDFERNIFEGKHFAKGRIRLVTILIIVVKLIFDKRFKQLKNNFIILKEAL